MFTGMISDVGRVREVKKCGDSHIAIETHFDQRAIEIGASIACAGICLTVVDKGGSPAPWFEVTASGETLSRTTAGEWQVDREINLERALRVGDELGGHIVTGHVDGTALILRAAPEGESLRLTLEANVELMGFIAPKGSVALDGVSLTINEVDGAHFGVNLIPHTLKSTTFRNARAGQSVNLEIDVLARYVARLVKV